MNILVVDDHPLFRDGFAHMVRVLRPSWNLHFSGSAHEALALFDTCTPDLVIVDVSLPGEDGFSLIGAIADRSAATPQIMISGRDDVAMRARARASGARSFLSKTETPEHIAATIDAVLLGASVYGDCKAAAELPALTVRQSELLALLAKGLSNKVIRAELNIAERTVRAHLTDLFQQLGVHSRMQAVVRARELGLIV